MSDDTEPEPWRIDPAEAWRRFDDSSRGRELHQAAAEAVYLDGVGLPTNEGIEPIMPTIRQEQAGAEADMHEYRAPVTDTEYSAVVPGTMGGWCAPTEAERWQWLTDDERAAEVAEARADADRHGYTVISVGGMVLPHPPSPAPFTDGMWPLPSVSIKVDTEAFQARMAEARGRFGELAAAMGDAFEQMSAKLGPVFLKLGRAFDDITYVTDGPPPPAAHDAPTALAALDYAETTEVRRRPHKRERAAAKRHYLAVRRHLAPAHRSRLRKVPMNQFGSLT